MHDRFRSKLELPASVHDSGLTQASLFPPASSGASCFHKYGSGP